MKTSNRLLGYLFIVGAMLFLTACPKTKNSANTSSNTSCTVRSDGSVRNQNGDLCTSGSAVCPNTGYYRDEDGYNQQCNPGERIYLNYNYPYSTNPTQYTDGCRQWTQMYNALYIPMLLNGDYVCVDYEWLNQYSMGSSYYNNYEYYYQYPPYNWSNAHKCGNPIQIDYNHSTQKICFENDDD
jgi:hypothetical protein